MGDNAKSTAGTRLYTIEAAKKLLHDEWEKGVECPCCTQYVKLYPHRINSQIAFVLIQMANLDEEWINIFSDLKSKTTMYSIARFWKLIEQRGNMPAKDTKTSGLWRLTPKGYAFVRSEIKIPKIAYIFNNHAYRFSADHIDIVQALGKKFSYSDLMK
jgi:hypothetical protein